MLDATVVPCDLPATEPLGRSEPIALTDMVAETIRDSSEPAEIVRQLASAIGWTPALATAWAVGLARSASPRAINAALLVLQNERRQAVVAS